MPTDLDRMFTALRTDADAVPLPAPDSPRRRGERRRRTRLAATALATACLLLAVGGGSWLIRGQRAPEPTTPPRPPGEPVDFRPLRQVGPGLTVAGPVRTAVTSTLDGTAYLGWRTDAGDLTVAALDVTTGRPRWPAHVLGRYDDWNGLVALPQGLVVVGEHNDGHVPDYTLFVVDPATGKLRWHREFDINGTGTVFFATALVLAGGDGGRTTALDWRTGAELWSVPGGVDPPVATTGRSGPADLGWYGGPHNTGLSPVFPGDEVLQVTKSGQLLTRDVRTGLILRPPRPGVAGPVHDGGEDVLAYGGRLYTVVSNETPYQVRVTPLDTPGEPRALHIPAAADRHYNRMFACDGGARICVADGTGTESGQRVTAFDPDTGAVAWQSAADLPDSPILSAAGDSVLFTGSPRGMGVLSTGGAVRLTPAAGTGGGWVTPGGLLELTGGAGGRQVTVSGVSTGDWTRIPLGQIPWPESTGFGCSWNARHLTCPVPGGFRVWQFAR